MTLKNKNVEIKIWNEKIFLIIDAEDHICIISCIKILICSFSLKNTSGDEHGH